ncbi:hypothetical protein [Staphylococcus aureus]|uniref:hypothetical protein n=1 Tax=Staphylococcus aureus TaxID=1280 RepID=UPI002181ED08|nr:hypothetical protein [Staphylococcus aureus]
MAFNKKIDSNNQEKNIEKALENAVSPNTSYKKIEIKKDNYTQCFRKKTNCII